MVTLALEMDFYPYHLTNAKCNSFHERQRFRYQWNFSFICCTAGGIWYVVYVSGANWI